MCQDRRLHATRAVGQMDLQARERPLGDGQPGLGAGGPLPHQQAVVGLGARRRAREAGEAPRDAPVPRGAPTGVGPGTAKASAGACRGVAAVAPSCGCSITFWIASSIAWTSGPSSVPRGRSGALASSGPRSPCSLRGVGAIPARRRLITGPSCTPSRLLAVPGRLGAGVRASSRPADLRSIFAHAQSAEDLGGGGAVALPGASAISPSCEPAPFGVPVPAPGRRPPRRRCLPSAARNWAARSRVSASLPRRASLRRAASGPEQPRLESCVLV